MKKCHSVNKGRNAPSVTHRWKRWVAVTCNHGRYTNHPVAKELWRWIDDYEPHTRVHLGDIWDETAWRSGAKGTADEGADIDADFQAGIDFCERLRPQLVFLGNHDIRPFERMEHPNALMRFAACECVKEIRKFIVKKLHAEMVDYDIETGWRLLGGAAFGHGYMYSENALRDHAEMLGRTIVMGHIHCLGSQTGRCLGAPVGYCAGCMAEIPELRYARKRRATTKWQNGWAYGEYRDDQITVHLHRIQRENLALRPASCA